MLSLLTNLPEELRAKILSFVTEAFEIKNGPAQRELMKRSTCATVQDMIDDNEIYSDCCVIMLPKMESVYTGVGGHNVRRDHNDFNGQPMNSETQGLPFKPTMPALAMTCSYFLSTYMKALQLNPPAWHLMITTLFPWRCDVKQLVLPTWTRFMTMPTKLSELHVEMTFGNTPETHLPEYCKVDCTDLVRSLAVFMPSDGDLEAILVTTLGLNPVPAPTAWMMTSTPTRIEVLTISITLNSLFQAIRCSLNSSGIRQRWPSEHLDETALGLLALALSCRLESIIRHFIHDPKHFHVNVPHSDNAVRPHRTDTKIHRYLLRLRSMINEVQVICEELPGVKILHFRSGCGTILPCVLETGLIPWGAELLDTLRQYGHLFPGISATAIV